MRGAAFLGWRVGTFLFGAVLGLAGIFLDNPWLVTAALTVLLIGVALRAWLARDPGSVEQEPEPPPQ